MRIWSKYGYNMTFPIKVFLLRKWSEYLYTLADSLSFEPLKQSISPVFVTGCGHSGTTLLATILGRNDDILPIGYESEAFFPNKSLYSAKELVSSWDSLAKQFEKKIFVEKTPKHVLCLKRIFKVLPKAKVILIVRDGRDVVSSLKKRFTETKISYLIDRWIVDNRAVVEWKNNNNVHLVRYEDLVKEPEETTKNLCEYLGIVYSKEMLRANINPYKNVANGNMALRSKQVSKPIYDNTGKWKKVLNKKDLEIFWRKASTMMKILGYDEN